MRRLLSAFSGDFDLRASDRPASVRDTGLRYKFRSGREPVQVVQGPGLLLGRVFSLSQRRCNRRHDGRRNVTDRTGREAMNMTAEYSDNLPGML